MTERAPIATVAVEQCPICYSSKRVFLFRGKDRLHGIPGEFSVVRCLDCASIYLSERPLDLVSYYPVESYAAFAGAGTTSHPSRFPARQLGLRQWRRLLLTLKRDGGSLLDIGCGTGDFLWVMHQVPGWRVSGLEPNPIAVRFATSRGLNVVQGELPESKINEQSDAITLWHVLEHTPNPHHVLAEIRRLLKPDGVLILSVPVVDSMEAKIFGECWAGYDVPRHLMTFTRASLCRLLEQAGFSAEEKFGVVQGLASLRLSLGLWLDNKPGLSHNTRTWLKRGILPVLFAYLRLTRGRHLDVAVFVARIAGMS